MKNIPSLPPYFPVTCHTDYLSKGSTFVAIKGMQTDGVNYIALAIQKGACTIVIENGVNIPEDAEYAIKQHNVTLCV